MFKLLYTLITRHWDKINRFSHWFSKSLWGLPVLFLVYFLVNPSATPRKVNEDLFKLNENEIADYFVQGLKTDYYDVYGRLDYRIEADRLLHFQDRYLSLLVNPNFFWFNDLAVKHWSIRSETGRLFHQQQRFEFEQQVKVNNVLNPGGERKPVLLTTEWLDVLLDQNLALTDADVRAVISPLESTSGKTGRASQIDAQGMHLFFADDRVEFLRQVQTLME